MLCDSTPRFLGPLVCRSVRHILLFFSSMASLLLPKWTSNLKWGSCPLARDWWSRVSSLDHLSNLLFVFVCFDSRPLISGKTQIQDENVVARKRSSTKGNLFHLKWNEMKLVEIPKNLSQTIWLQLAYSWISNPRDIFNHSPKLVMHDATNHIGYEARKNESRRENYTIYRNMLVHLVVFVT